LQPGFPFLQPLIPGPPPAKRKVAQTIAMTSAVRMREVASSGATLTPPALSALPY
jgi:hypothetical protein